ncbi:MAG: methylated-DNA--[protein]-cysteine S-methyltransferase [Myxococcales bacterium]|nr:methylated-DNA--[protein]-cysteine S-methyltransferase [Polyangiaceae bacterium]MDW8249540.1 methylated-DNA--[protein]-cysteine S-methyltransferase [Myxococcales bacterium]
MASQPILGKMSRDYAKIEQALAFLLVRSLERPSLEEAAAHVGLNKFHFQQMFTRWAGVSPQRFLHYLSPERTRACLEASRGVLLASAEQEIFGSMHFYDRFLAYDRRSLTEHCQGGDRIEICHGWIESPFGEALIMVSPRGLCGLTFSIGQGREDALKEMTRRWPQAIFRENLAAVEEYAPPLFASERPRLALDLRGTPFQRKVWEALLRIPAGALVSYDALAIAVTGSPRGARAVGAAVGANPVGWLIPCHRVIHRSGVIGRYRWGRPRKLALLGWEAAQRDLACG